MGFGCSSKWNPDHQFEMEISELKMKSQVRQTELDEEAFKKIINLKSDLQYNLQDERDLQDWILSNRNRFSLLARTSHNSLTWEKRIIMFSDIVSYKYGLYSPEYQLACKKDFKIFFLCNLNEITSFEF